jgi:hypothetical protein
MVGLQTLNLAIGVRVPASQPQINLIAGSHNNDDCPFAFLALLICTFGLF